MSTDKQSAASPADQIARCRDFARARGFGVVDDLVVEDAGVSGASRHNRPRLLDLISRIDEWDVLLCWDSSRLARDSEDLGWIRNRLRANRRTGFEVSTGLDLFNVGAKVLGVMAEEYLTKLRADTHRGLRGRAERKLSTGGTPYGYRTESLGEGAGFRLVVDEDEAAVVRRIFAAYLAGEGYRAIAQGLNADRIPSARGKGWAPTAIYELVRNPIYRGELVWNRSEWVKDHETGRRRRHERPPAEWVRQHDESWRIVPDETWHHARDLAERRGRAYRRSPDGRRIAGPRHGAGHRSRGRGLFSGLLECAQCGGSFYGVKRADRLRCGWHVDRGSAICRSDLVVPRPDLEERILETVRRDVLAPDVLAYAVEEALGLAREALDDGGREADRRRLASIDTEIENAARLAARTGQVEAVVRVVETLERERQEIEARLARSWAAGASATDLRGRLERLAGDLRGVLAGSPDDCRRAFLGLLGGRRMRVGADPDRGFRVDGIFEVPWNECAPPEPLDSRGGATGSGGGI